LALVGLGAQLLKLRNPRERDEWAVDLSDLRAERDARIERHRV
jgi:hypothetical protein